MRKQRSILYYFCTPIGCQKVIFRQTSSRRHYYRKTTIVDCKMNSNQEKETLKKEEETQIRYERVFYCIIKYEV